MSLKEEVVAAIRDVPDFPKPGIVFKDISPLLANGPLFERVTDWLVERFRKDHPSHVLGIESRGFLFGTPVAWADETAVTMRTSATIRTTTRVMVGA